MIIEDTEFVDEDAAFYAWLHAWRAECDTILAVLRAIFTRAGV